MRDAQFVRSTERATASDSVLRSIAQSSARIDSSDSHESSASQFVGLLDSSHERSEQSDYRLLASESATRDTMRLVLSALSSDRVFESLRLHSASRFSDRATGTSDSTASEFVSLSSRIESVASKTDRTFSDRSRDTSSDMASRLMSVRASDYVSELRDHSAADKISTDQSSIFELIAFDAVLGDFGICIH